MKKETTKKKEIQSVNIHDDELMCKLGFRPIKQVPRDKSVWSKTQNEHRILKDIKYSAKKEDMHFHTIPPKRATICSKLIVYLEPNKVFPKSTYSQECFNTHINDVLGKFRVFDSKVKLTRSVVVKYSFNGRTYGPDELPYCCK